LVLFNWALTFITILGDGIYIAQNVIRKITSIIRGIAMKKLANLIPSIMIALILLIMTGCSGGGSESDVVSNSESYDTPGVAVEATTYANASTITLLADSETGTGYQIVEDGATFEKGSRVKFGIRVTDGKYTVNKVVISDGGGNQIDTTYNDTLKLYLCNYPVSDTDRLMPVLIQAFHPNGQASKAKYVFRTEEFARVSQLIRKGLGVLIGKDILESAKGMSLSGITVNSLAPSNGKLNTIMALNSNILFNLKDGLTGNEGTDEEVTPTLKLSLYSAIPLDMGINSMSLDDMLGGLTGDIGADMSGLNLAAKPLYLIINGAPKDTTDIMAALTIGLFAKEDKDTTKFPSGVTLYPGSSDDIPLTNDNDSSAIEVSLSQENMTQFVSELLNGNVVIPALSIPTAVPSYDNVKPAVLQQMKISFNRNGIAFDFTTANPLLIINDLRIEYLENGKKMWMISLDLAFKLDAGSHSATIENNAKKDFGSYLDIYLTLVPEYSHCAVLKDDMGITMFDHKDFPSLLVDSLKGMLPSDNEDKGDLELSILMGAKLGGKDGKIVGKINADDTEDYGFAMILMDDGASAVSDEAGRCFLKMATEETDLTKAGLCFINTASN
jgi:hypothetical protein